MTPTIGGTWIGPHIVVGGVEDDVYSVVFFAIHDRVPVFHKHGWWTRDSRQDNVDATVCGRATWDPVRKRVLTTNLPTVHAVRFGRPCLSCWPELREDEFSA